MKRLVAVFLCLIFLCGCSRSPASTRKQTPTKLTGNVFWDVTPKGHSSSGDGIIQVVTVDKVAAQTASAEDYAEFLDKRVSSTL